MIERSITFTGRDVEILFLFIGFSGGQFGAAMYPYRSPTEEERAKITFMLQDILGLRNQTDLERLRGGA